MPRFKKLKKKSFKTFIEFITISSDIAIPLKQREEALNEIYLSRISRKEGIKQKI